MTVETAAATTGRGRVPQKGVVLGFLTRRRGGKRLHWTDWATWAYLAFGIALMFGPIVWLLLSSFKTQAGLQEFPPTFLPLSQVTVAVGGYDDPLPLFRVTMEDGTVRELAEVRRIGIVSTMVDPAAPVLGALGALGVVWGSLNALRQERLKLIVAYSTVAQIGYLFLLFPLAAGGALATAWAGAHYHALSHACAKAGAFLAAGNILLSHGDDRLGTISQGASRHRISLLAFALAGVSLMGLPPSGGFIAKWLLVTAAVEAGQWWWAAVVAGGGILAAAYIFRVLGLVMAAAPPEIPALRRVPRVAAYTALTLALAAIGLGLASAPPLALIGIGQPADPAAGPGAAMGAAESWP